MTSTLCEHPRRRHTVWWWIEDGDPVPVPRSVSFDNRRDAMRAVDDALTEPPVYLRWVKVFRADNEAYECFRWVNPEPMPEPEPVPVSAPVTKRRRWWRRG